LSNKSGGVESDIDITCS